MGQPKAIVGVFSYLDDLLKAIEGAKEEKLEFTVYSPVPVHEITEATFTERSKIRFFNVIGAVTGITFGFSLAILTSMDWPLRTSAKDIVSIPGFVVIGYECTILFGCVFTLLGLLALCKVPNILRKVGYDPRFSQDKFGLVINGNSDREQEIAQALKDYGAEEVLVKGAL